MARQASTADQARAPGFQTGDSYFMVLEPAGVLGPDGGQGYNMLGPFAQLFAAQQYANSRPGSMITVTLVLHQVAAAVLAPAASLLKG